jgi:hypothetical protein
MRMRWIDLSFAQSWFVHRWAQINADYFKYFLCPLVLFRGQLICPQICTDERRSFRDCKIITEEVGYLYFFSVSSCAFMAN